MNDYIDLLQTVVYSYANSDFEIRIPITYEDSDLNIIASAINVLGEELKEKTISKDYLGTIVSKLPLPIIVFDKLGNLELINPLGVKFLSLKSIEINQNIYEFLPKIILENVLKLDNSQKQRQIVFQILKKRNKQIDKFYQCKLNKLKHSDNTKYIFIAEDITELKRNEFLKMNAFLEGEENERKRLAYDLHDSLGQELNIISLFIESLKSMDRNSPDFDTYLDKIKLHNSNSIQTLRDVSYNLMPSYIVNNNLFEVIKQLVNNLNLLHKTSIAYTYPDSVNGITTKDKELMIFRVIQEFLSNSIKHSKAKEITLKIDLHKNIFTFQLKDNGIGFDVNLLKHKNGLNNMVHRLDLINAPYQFNSLPKIGTTLKFKIYV